MAQYKLIPWDEACMLYDLGVREIACAAVPFGGPDQKEAERYARRGSWEPVWVEPAWRKYRVAALMWTYCVEVE